LLQVRPLRLKGKNFIQNIAPHVMGRPATATVQPLPNSVFIRRSCLNREANLTALSSGRSLPGKSRCRDMAQNYRKRTGGTWSITSKHCPGN